MVHNRLPFAMQGERFTPRLSIVSIVKRGKAYALNTLPLHRRPIVMNARLLSACVLFEGRLPDR